MPTSRLAQLADEISGSDPGDPSRAISIQRELLRLRDLVRRRCRLDLADCLDAAAAATPDLAQLDPLQARTLRDVVGHLVRLVGRSLEQEPAPARELQPPPALPRARRSASSKGLGELLVRLGIVTEDHVHIAQELHTQSGQPLDRCLVRIGAATKEEVDGAKRLQAHMHRSDVESPRPTLATATGKATPSLRRSRLIDTRLVEVLRSRGLVDDAQLWRARDVQHRLGVRIGEALVHTGAATWQEILEATMVEEEERRRR
jgi:hypothetical protein